MANARVPDRSPPDWVPPLLRMEGCLSAHWRHWQALGAESWVLFFLGDGYHILFRDYPPPLTRTTISFPTSRAGSPWLLALCQEVGEMLSMSALEIILDPGPGFSSRLFLVEKIAVAWRPMIALSHHLSMPVEMPMSKGWYSPLMFPFLLREYLAYIDMISNTVTWCHHLWIFFLPTAPSIFMPGLGWKVGWEQAPFHVALQLAPLGSWHQTLPQGSLAVHQQVTTCLSVNLLFYSEGKYLSEQMMFLSS